MAVKLGISSYSYNWAFGQRGYDQPPAPMTAADLIAHGALIGAKVVELCDAVPLTDMGETELAALADQAQQAGIELGAGTSGVETEHLSVFLGICTALCAKRIRVLLQSPRYRPSIDEACRSISEVLPEYEAAGVTIMVENHDAFSCEQLRGLMEQVDSPYCRICLDTSNSLGMLETTEQVFDVLGAFAAEIHYKDYEIHRVPNLMGFEVLGTAAGQGAVNPELVVDFVRSRAATIPVILELWPPYRGTIEQSIRMESAWVDTSFRFLSQLGWDTSNSKQDKVGR